MLAFPNYRPVSWVLWRYLLYPNAHPAYRRILRSSKGDVQITRSVRVVMAFGSLAVCSFLTGITQAGSIIAVPLLLALILFGGGFPAVVWTMGISTALARERTSRTYETFSVPPSGALGLNLAVCAATLHRHDAFGWLNILHNLIVGFFSFVLVSVVLITAVRTVDMDGWVLLRFLLDVVALSVAAYLDRVQAIVAACLIGMLTPTHNRENVHIWSAVLLVGFQAVTFAAAALVTLSYSLLVGAVAFYLLREVILALLWWWLNYTMNSDPRRLDVAL